MTPWPLPDAAATQWLGRCLARSLLCAEHGAVIALEGELGAGKTALAQAALAQLGHDGPVVSPTYTLVEPYAVAGRNLYHLDLYRLGVPEELEYLGLREYDSETDWWLVEWPARGAGFLPPVDVSIRLRYAEIGRFAEWKAYTQRGHWLTNTLAALIQAGPDSADS